VGASGYTVSRTHGGIRLTLHVARRSYPRRALIPVTARLTNLTRKGLYVEPPHPSQLEDGCDGFAFFYAARSNGANAEPAQTILSPSGGCPVDTPVPLPVGRSVVEREMIVLWTGRIYAEAGTSFRRGRGWRVGPGVKEGPTATVRLYSARAPVISVKRISGIATVHRPPGARGRMYYRDWAICGTSERAVPAWTPAARPQVSVPCRPAQQWHIDVAWLNTPVASVHVGVQHAD
jgi:hypothetical protein